MVGQALVMSPTLKGGMASCQPRLNHVNQEWIAGFLEEDQADFNT